MAEQEKSWVAKMTADWRNIALAIGAVLILILLIAWQTAAQSWQSSRVVVVGNTVVSEGDVVNALKTRFGSELVQDKVMKNLWLNFASQRGLEVAPAEIQEYIKFRVEAMLARRSVPIDTDKVEDFLKSTRGRDEYFKAMLAKNGVTPEALWEESSYDIIHARMIVPDADVQAAMSKGMGQVSIPARFVVNQYIFATKADAAKALKAAKGGDDHALETALNAQNVNTVLYYSAENPLMARFAPALAQLKRDDYSQPLSLKDPQSGMDLCIIFRLREMYPAEKLNPETSADLVRQSLLSQDQQAQPDKQKYAQIEQTLFAQALNKVDVQFVSSDYPQALDWYKNLVKRNPDIPGVTSDTGAPGAPSTLPQLPGPAQPRGRAGNGNR